MPRRSADYMDQRRRQILEAATECALAKGWGRTTIDDIAAAAGLSKGAVYIHFETKQALLAGLVERDVERLRRIGECRTFADFRREVLRDVDLIASSEGGPMGMHQLEIQLEVVRDPALRPLVRDAADALIAAFAEAIARLRPDLAAREVRTRALTFVYLVTGMTSFRALTDRVSETAMRGVLERELDALEQKDRA